MAATRPEAPAEQQHGPVAGKHYFEYGLLWVRDVGHFTRKATVPVARRVVLAIAKIQNNN